MSKSGHLVVHARFDHVLEWRHVTFQWNPKRTVTLRFVAPHCQCTPTALAHSLGNDPPIHSWPLLCTSNLWCRITGTIVMVDGMHHESTGNFPRQEMHEMRCLSQQQFCGTFSVKKDRLSARLLCCLLAYASVYLIHCLVS